MSPGLMELPEGEERVSEEAGVNASLGPQADCKEELACELSLD